MNGGWESRYKDGKTLRGGRKDGTTGDGRSCDSIAIKKGTVDENSSGRKENQCRLESSLESEGIWLHHYTWEIRAYFKRLRTAVTQLTGGEKRDPKKSLKGIQADGSSRCHERKKKTLRHHSRKGEKRT